MRFLICVAKRLILNRKRLIKICAELLLLLAAAALGAYLYWLKSIETINTLDIPARIDLYEVKEGMTATHVSEDLMGADVPSFIVRLWVKRHPELQSIQRGNYRIDGTLTLKQILALMVMGKTSEKAYPTITIIEGSTLSDVKRTLKRFCGSCDQVYSEMNIPADFIISTLHSDPTLIAAIGGAASSLEGLLLPATYQIKSPSRVSRSIGEALRDMAKLMKKEWPSRSDRVYVRTPYDALIVASIIERETAIDAERPQVAAVFYNRMRKNMRLQTDPTVMYGISPDFSGRLSKAQLRKDTPYNTYTREGLPPTPISMPSKSSILAALHPDDTQALYFVAADIDPSNGHVFTSNLKDHNRAVSDYRKKVSDYKKQKSAAATDDDSQEKSAKDSKEDVKKASDKQSDGGDDTASESKDSAKQAVSDKDVKSGSDSVVDESKTADGAAKTDSADKDAGVSSKKGEVDLTISDSSEAKPQSGTNSSVSKSAATEKGSGGTADGEAEKNAKTDNKASKTGSKSGKKAAVGSTSRKNTGVRKNSKARVKSSNAKKQSGTSSKKQ